jgi:hypothetical protein
LTSPLHGASFRRSFIADRLAVHIVRTTVRIELEGSWNQHDSLRPIPILEHREADGRGAVDKDPAASALLL